MQVIFDLDGTLLETARYSVATARRMAEALGVPKPSAEQVKRAIGLPLPEFLRAILPDAEPAAIAAHFVTIEDEEIRRNLVLFPGVHDVLDGLRAEGMATVVCSNGNTEYINTVVDLTGLRPKIDAVVSARDFADKTAALAHLVTQDPQAVMVGDTYMDTDAAAAVRLPSIACLYGYGDPALLQGATFFAQNPLDILDAARFARYFFSHAGEIAAGSWPPELAGSDVAELAWARFHAATRPV
ncbi:MAG: HAD family hydrolase [Propionibacteriaceae bacterium]|nr:HAD family hydrolase [Propionibacteriaceae bacterium]